MDSGPQHARFSFESPNQTNQTLGTQTSCKNNPPFPLNSSTRHHLQKRCSTGRNKKQHNNKNACQTQKGANHPPSTQKKDTPHQTKNVPTNNPTTPPQTKASRLTKENKHAPSQINHKFQPESWQLQRRQLPAMSIQPEQLLHLPVRLRDLRSPKRVFFKCLVARG